MKVCIIGTGLMGGSLAVAMRARKLATEIIGVDNNPDHIEEAIGLEIIDQAMSLEEGIAYCDLIVLAIPGDASINLLPKVLDLVTDQIVIELGSTKELLLNKVLNHPNRSRLVSSHPMAGTEYSGPRAAISDLYTNKRVVLCDIEFSDKEALKLVEQLYRDLDMKIDYMESKSHDLHAAYVSHIAHISAFALALTVLKKEEQEEKILELAGGGFASAVRLAKSSSSMWTPIFKQNQDNVLEVLRALIEQLQDMEQVLASGQFDRFDQLIKQANTIKRILN